MKEVVPYPEAADRAHRLAEVVDGARWSGASLVGGSEVTVRGGRRRRTTRCPHRRPRRRHLDHRRRRLTINPLRDLTRTEERELEAEGQNPATFMDQGIDTIHIAEST
ncbi:hypothetical protein ACFVTF_21905 [Kitasatospora sp. NPDC057940]|uniref:hypothetical protein n=1 Tax=Kitasatospora sp. NPDC057940 TaxID=3346285 RepID=UPI0036DA2A04